MSHRRLLRACLLTTAISTVCTPALAQTPPPPYNNVDEYGVDLTTGQYTFSMVEGSIGSGPGAIALTRTWIGGGAVDNWSGGAYQATENGAAVMKVEFGSVSDTFIISGASFASKKQDGATLVETATGYLYRGRDGTELEFASTWQTGAEYTTLRGPSCRPFEADQCSIPVRRRDPNGMEYRLSWDIDEACLYTNYETGVCGASIAHYRFRGVTSSAGYRMDVRYASSIQGQGKNGPPGAWRQRTGIEFYNSAVSPTAQVSINYSNPSAGILQIVDGGGQTWRFSSSNGSLVGVQRPGSATSNPSISYGANTVAVTLDGVTANYIKSGTTISRTDPAGRTRTVVSDAALGRPLSDTLSGGGLNLATSFTYDGGGRVKTVARPEGDRTQYDYDARGNVAKMSQVAKPAAGGQVLETTFAFPATCANPVTCNLPTSSTDARGATTIYGHDPNHGGITSVTSPAGANGVQPQKRFGYSTVGGVALLTSISECQTQANCTGTADERRTTIAYNHSNLLPTSATIQSGDGSLSATATASYDAVGNVTAMDGPLPGSGDTTRMFYDGARRLKSIVSPDPDGAGPLRHRAVDTRYDAAGHVDLQQAGTANGDGSGFVPLEQISIGYDGNGRKLQQSLIAGGAVQAVTHYRYDAVGRVLCVAQRMDPGQWSGQGDACAPQTNGSQGPDRITHTGYDEVGRAVSTTTAYNTPEASTEHVTYTSNGEVQTAKDANGNTTTYGYDGFDRLATTTYPGGSFEQLTYDAAGNVTTRRLRDGQAIGYGYDALNRLTRKNVPSGAIHEYGVSYVHDNLGRLTQATDDNGHFSAVGYDALGRKISEQSNWTTRHFEYDPAGRMTRLTWGDGFFVTYEYDQTGAMTVVRENGGFALAAFGYDGLGRRTTLSRGNGTVTSYGYDAASRLSSLTQDLAGGAHDLSVTFGHNPAGQITSRSSSNDAYAFTGHYNVDRSYSVNGLNQYTSAGATGLSYDGRGNLTNSGSNTYSYTSENRLATGLSYIRTYDALGRFHWISNGGPLTWMQYDGDRLIEEFNGNGVQRRYVHGPGADEPLVWYEGAGTSDRRWLHADERGSVVAVTNGSGQAMAINTYDEHGIPGAGNIGRFQYTGQKWVPELGMYDYKARMYSPTLGRFMQTDPIGYADGMNWYNYVGGDPVNATDPSGLMQVTSYCTGGYAREDSFGNVHVFSQSCTYSGGGSSGFGFSPAEQQCHPTGRGGAPVCRDEVALGPEEAQSDKPKICKGRALVYAGNPRHVGRTGGMLRPIRPGAAAIIPRQWTGARTAGPVLRAGGVSVTGRTGGGQQFKGLDDTAGNLELGPDPQAVLMERAAGSVYVELVTGQHEGQTPITITIPAGSELSCPAGTTQVEG